jgi:hypothetical protein
MPGAVENAHQHHPDFRAGAPPRIFATLGYPDGRHGMVKLTADQQADVLETDRTGSFAPAAGKWGQKGATTVALAKADRELVKLALGAAWKNVAEERVERVEKVEKPRRRRRRET